MSMTRQGLTQEQWKEFDLLISQANKEQQQMMIRMLQERAYEEVPTIE